MGRIICWFSCGVASAVATKLAIARYGKDNIIVARCIVREEHPDNNRFARECAAWFGLPILDLINEKHNGSIYDVFESRNYIAGVRGAPCTMLLKKQVRLDFQLPTDKHVFGYCLGEEKRFNDLIDANNIDVVAPLIDANLTHSDCLAMVQDAGIEIPVMYKLGYKHNNCVGCVKSTGQGYWNKIRDDFPEQFARMAKLSRKLKVKLIRINNERSFLDELVTGTGNYKDEPEIQCGIFCEMAKQQYSSA